MPALSILMPQGSYASSCGYCHSPGDPSSTRAGASAAQLSCDVYQKMIDRGWRRSGTYCYKPDMPRTCCPQYPIRLSATEFVPSRSQRQLVNRWNRYVQSGDTVDNATNASNDVDMKDICQSSSETFADAKGSKRPQFSWTGSLHASEQTFIGNSSLSSRHKFEVTLEPSSYTKEKFQLYENYQTNIHHDERVTSTGFKRFLVDSPLIAEPIPYQNQPASHIPQSYGSYHQLYRLDGELIAMAVLDILPSCVSSVYFMYDNTWERFSLGKLSALREAALAREIHDAGATQCKFLYLGYYIHTCQKMRYKGDYKPSELADPETFGWHSLEKCVPILDKHRYGCFTNPERSLNEPPPPPPGAFHIDESALEAIHAVETIDGPRIAVVPLTKSSLWSATGMRQASLEVVEALGLQLAAEIIFLR